MNTALKKQSIHLFIDINGTLSEKRYLRVNKIFIGFFADLSRKPLKYQNVVFLSKYAIINKIYRQFSYQTTCP
jgi:hypothetical protein